MGDGPYNEKGEIVGTRAHEKVVLPPEQVTWLGSDIEAICTALNLTPNTVFVAGLENRVLPPVPTLATKDVRYILEEQPTVPDKPADLLVLNETDYPPYSQQVGKDGFIVSGYQPLYEPDLELVAICTYDNTKNISTVSQKNLDRYRYKPEANKEEAAKKRTQLRAKFLADEPTAETTTPPLPSTYIYKKISQ